MESVYDTILDHVIVALYKRLMLSSICEINVHTKVILNGIHDSCDFLIT